MDEKTETSRYWDATRTKNRSFYRKAISFPAPQDLQHLLECLQATHSSILAWETPWTEDRRTWGATVHGVAKESDMT